MLATGGALRTGQLPAPCVEQGFRDAARDASDRSAAAGSSHGGLFGSRNFFQKIEPKDLSNLQMQLDSVYDKSADPFAFSAAYFGMTGRNGLWVYGNPDGFVLIARHPNDENSVLVFPPYGNATTKTIKEAIKHRHFPKGNIELARASDLESTEYREQLANGVIPEEHQTILDWRFPVHVVSSKNIVARQGPNFRQLRQNFNRAANVHNLTAEPLDLHRHSKAIKAVVKEWAEIGNKPGFTFEDLTSPTQSLLKLMKDDNPLNIQGVVVRDEKETAIGFWLWHEAPDGRAMSLARVSIGHLESHGKIRGAAEFGAVKMAEILKDRGINQICLGGSETSSLDDWKKKLNAGQSFVLTSMRIDRGAPAVRKG